MFACIHLHLGIHEPCHTRRGVAHLCVPVLSLHVTTVRGLLMDRGSIHRRATCHTAAQLISLLPRVLAVHLAVSTPHFPHISHSHELLFLPKSLSQQEGQGRRKKVLCQVVAQEKTEYAHVSYIIFIVSLPFFSINSNHPPTTVHLGFSHDSWQI